MVKLFSIVNFVFFDELADFLFKIAVKIIIMVQTAIITGASRGIGRKIALQLAAEGISVVLIARNTAQLANLCREINDAGGTATYYTCDLNQPDELVECLKKMESTVLNQPLALINNAGYGGPFTTVADTDAGHWDTIFNINVKAPFLFIKQLLPLMQAAGVGRIINMGSVLGSAGAAYSGAYSAAKHALAGLTRSVAIENADKGITCNIIQPGFIDTESGAIQTDAGTSYYNKIITTIPAHRQGDVKDIAALVSFLLSPGAAYVNGCTINVDGGLTAGYNFVGGATIS